MNDYFSKVRQGLGDAVEQRRHLPWYSRLLRAAYARPLAVVIAALVIATPAVGAVSGWFSVGKPNVGPPAHAGIMWGLEKPGSSRLLPMRTADPLGGPAWGLQMVKTSRGDTCVQLGRVEKGQIGSLGIDDAWNNDGLFHPISAKDSADDQCGSTDATGYGYVNVSMFSEDASANIGHKGQGTSRTSQGCAPRYPQLAGARKHPFPKVHSTAPLCPPGGDRMVFFGMLGPDAVSVTYRKPGGGLATQKTVGGVGEYLLVFDYTQANCNEYATSARSSVSCNGEMMGAPSPSLPGAVTKVTYKDGRTCSLVPTAKLETAFEAFEKHVIARLGRPRRTKAKSTADGPSINISPTWLAKYRTMLRTFMRTHHLSETEFITELSGHGQCPTVGWVAPKEPKVTRADVATPIVMRVLPAGKYGCPVPAKLHMPGGCTGASPSPSELVPVEWSFKARRAVTNSRSWYEWSVFPDKPSSRQGCGGGSSFSTYANVTKGQMLRYSQLFSVSCSGRYTVTVGYVAYASPNEPDDGGGGMPGRDGSLIVGRASFTVR